MSEVAYNGVLLPYANQTSFRTSPVYDEVSQTDPYVTRYEIDVMCVLNFEHLLAIFPSFDGLVDNTPEMVKALKVKLEAPRKRLSYKVNGVEMIPGLAGVAGTVDALNGPKPKEAILHEINSTTFILTWGVVAHYVYNPDSLEPAGDNQAGNPVLFNRWTETVDIDGCNYTTRTRRGQFKIRSDNLQGWTADELRSQLAVLSVPTKFLRKKSSYTITPDGLGLEYTIVDEQQAVMPPSPAFEADGWIVETSAPPGDAKRGVQAMVRLRGDQLTPKAILIENAVYIAATVLRTNGVFLPPAGVPAGPHFDQRRDTATFDGTMLRVGLYKNEVEFMMRAWTNVPRQRLGSVPLTAFGLVQTPMSERNYIPEFRDYGSGTPLLLQAAAYWDPRLRNTILGAGNITPADSPVRTRDRERVQHTAGRQTGQEGVRPV